MIACNTNVWNATTMHEIIILATWKWGDLFHGKTTN